MSERGGVEIDYCPECRGVWLDRGELDKIIEKANQEIMAGSQRAVPPAPAPYSHGHGHGHPDYYRHKRKKSFLEEIFD
jgi:Zn-finger nucleic acid-binding protein